MTAAEFVVSLKNNQVGLQRHLYDGDRLVWYILGIVFSKYMGSVVRPRGSQTQGGIINCKNDNVKNDTENIWNFSIRETP